MVKKIAFPVLGNSQLIHKHFMVFTESNLLNSFLDLTRCTFVHLEKLTCTLVQLENTLVFSILYCFYGSLTSFLFGSGCMRFPLLCRRIYQERLMPGSLVLVFLIDGSNMLIAFNYEKHPLVNRHNSWSRQLSKKYIN